MVQIQGGLLKMLSIEHYTNLMNHIRNAQISLDYMIERETVNNDEELMRYVIDVQKQLESIVDILNFLVVRNVRENPDFDKCLNLMDEIEKTIISRLQFISFPELDKILKRIESLGNSVEDKALKLQLVA